MLVQLSLRSVLLLLSAATAVVAAPTQGRSDYTVKDSHHVPRKWSNVGDAPRDHVLRLNIALNQSQFDELERHLYEGE